MTDDRPHRPPLVRYLMPVAAGFLATVAVALLVVFGRSTGGGSGGGATADEPAAAPVVSAASASCARGPSRDSRGTPTSYEPAHAVDGDPATAWRCDGDGAGQHITLELAGPARVTRIGLVPGLAKTDPGDGTDRYAQNRRIAQVRVSTDAGDVEAGLETDAGDRVVQYVDVGATTRSVTLTILRSVPGSEQNGQAAIDSVAISEIVVS
ncbi:MAG: discoidin domain-containing protein [Pseudonocardia sp.]|nr:discoidin domain-containing protein [Pseudonocardia sp.]